MNSWQDGQWLSASWWWWRVCLCVCRCESVQVGEDREATAVKRYLPQLITPFSQLSLCTQYNTMLSPLYVSYLILITIQQGTSMFSVKSVSIASLLRKEAVSIIAGRTVFHLSSHPYRPLQGLAQRRYSWFLVQLNWVEKEIWSKMKAEVRLIKRSSLDWGCDR